MLPRWQYNDTIRVILNATNRQIRSVLFSFLFSKRQIKKVLHHRILIFYRNSLAKKIFIEIVFFTVSRSELYDIDEVINKGKIIASDNNAYII